MNTYKKGLLKNWGLAFEGGGVNFGYVRIGIPLIKLSGVRYRMFKKSCPFAHIEFDNISRAYILLVIWGSRLKLYFTSPRTIHSLSEPVPPHWW